MKKNSESFELNAEDITEAIQYWLGEIFTAKDQSPDFEVAITVSPFGADGKGGERYIVSAKAVRL